MKTKIFILIALFLGTKVVVGQTNPLLNQYFNNTYLANPSMAGVKQGGAVDLAFRAQWGSIPGSPVLQNLTAAYGWERVGVGLNMSLDKAGLQSQTRVLASYAYHLPISLESKLHFGISGGFMNQRINVQDIIGDPNDNQVGAYNSDYRTYFDGDFGIGLTSNRINLDLSIVNLQNLWRRDNFKLVNTPVGYASAGYKINVGQSIFQPKVAYRSFTKVDDIVDVGGQFGIANQQVLFTAMYHTSKAASFGLGMHFRNKYLINAAYSTPTGNLSQFSGDSFEINLGLLW